jgi:hypothetical protein
VAVFYQVYINAALFAIYIECFITIMMPVDIPMILKAACHRLLMLQPTVVALKDLQPGQFATIGGQIEKVTIFIRASFLLMRFFTYHEILFAFLIR